MNRIQAEKIDKELKLIMGEKAEKLNIDKQVGKDLIEKYIEFHPDENSKMGMLDLNSQHSRSVKLPNIIINQKEMWLEEVGIIACSTIPKNKVEFWKLLLYVAVVTLRLMNIKITDEQAYIVAYLHINHMYETGQNEQEFYAEFTDWYKKQTENEISKNKIKNSLNGLINLKSVEIKNGKVLLKEKVYRNKLEI